MSAPTWLPAEEVSRRSGPLHEALSRCAAGLDVRIVARATSAADVQQCSRRAASEGLRLLPIASGRRVAVRPPGPIALFDARELGTITVSPEACVVRAGAGATWREVESALDPHGLTSAHLFDAIGDASVGGSLAMPSPLPPLWRTGSVRAACIGMTAVTAEGALYRHVESPRTASGPDLRGLWFEAEGRTGVIVDASFEVTRRGEVRWMSGEASAAEIQRALNLVPGTISCRGRAGGRWTLRIGGPPPLADFAERALEGAGLRRADPAAYVVSRGLVACAPWRFLEDLDARKRSVDVQAAGATHVAVAMPAEDGAAAAAIEAELRPLLAAHAGLSRIWRVGIFDDGWAGGSDGLLPLARLPDSANGSAP